jgi:hypothetical protein
VRSLRMAVQAAFALCLLCSAAWADVVKFSIPLEPDQQGKPGKGTANLTLDTATKTLTGTIEYSGLSAPPEMAAFLSPPEKQGGNPGTMPIPIQAKAPSPINIKMQIPDAAVAGLKSGEWIILLGTKQAPEIGGEVKPAQ